MDNFDIRERLIILGPLATHVLFFSSSGLISGEHHYIFAVPTNRVSNDISNMWCLFFAKKKTRIDGEARTAEHVFVNLLRRPGIDFQPGGRARQPYLSYRDARLTPMKAGEIDSPKSVPGLHIRLQIRAQISC
jgi:hypothetical protein